METTAHPIFWTAALLVPLLLWAALVVSLRTRLRTIYERHVGDPRRERLFVASMGFYLAFALVRAITHLIRAGVGPFRNVSAGGVHVHHLVWGILLLLLIGYLWLNQVGTGVGRSSPRLSRATALLYGVGAALTLDEFALWLRLEDVYWTRQGRESVDAVILFGALLSITFWGGPFFRGLAREIGGRRNAKGR
jgi:hypothetical protein